MKVREALLGLGFAALFAVPASAEVIFAGPSGPQATDSSITVTFNSGAATTADLSFTVDGYLTLDGVNTYEDDFALSLNGTPIFSGTFNLGGGSNTTQAVVFLNPYGATFSNPTNNGTGVGRHGGQEIISFGDVLPLLAGTNTLVFSYTSLPRPGHYGFQGLSDEGWGIQNVTTSIPEPSTWAMMLLSFASLGFAGYRSTRKSTSATA